MTAKSSSSKDNNFKIDSHYLRLILEEMIEINSVIGNEHELAFFIAQELQKLGLAIQLEDVEPKRPNVYGSFIFSEGPTLTFNSHLDTVAVCDGWSTDPFIPIEKDGKLFGLGSVDMKGGIACQLAAIKALVESNNKLTGQIHFTGVIDEEAYGKGARKMISNSFFGAGKTDGIIIAEPFTGTCDSRPLPLGMTGKVLYEITFKGKSAHAFTPEKGINAITDAGQFLAELDKAITDQSDLFHLPRDSEFEGSFCSLKIEGGYRIYSVVVPEECKIILNRLIIPGETKESVQKDLLAFIDKLQLQSEVSIEIIPPFYLPYKTQRDDPLVQALEESYTQKYKIKPLFNYGKMITDANIFAGEADIPAVLFGPKGNNLHAAGEYVIIESLKSTAEVYANMFYNFQKKRS
ncbi:MAG: M20 family metallopeptidase [Asgard group archaeon]|nr:M20 family metallopeptidase [Asgard group archaeon]